MPGFLEIIVDDDLIVYTRCLGVHNLLLSLGQALLDGFFLVGGSATQPLFQDLNRRRLQEHEACVQVGLLDLLDTLCQYSVSCPSPLSVYLPTHLHLNVQNARSALISYVFHCLHACPVEIASELRMLNEATVFHHLQEVLLGRVVVVDAILLAFSRCSGGMRHGETETIGIRFE